MMIHDMIIVGDGDHVGGTAGDRHPEGYEADAAGIATARKLRRRLVEVAQLMRG